MFFRIRWWTFKSFLFAPAATKWKTVLRIWVNIKVLIFLVFKDRKVFRFFFSCMTSRDSMINIHITTPPGKLQGLYESFDQSGPGLVFHGNIHLLQPTQEATHCGHKGCFRHHVFVETWNMNMSFVHGHAQNAVSDVSTALWVRSKNWLTQQWHWASADDCSCGFFGWFLYSESSSHCATKCTNSLQHPQTCQHSLSACGSAAQEAASSTAAAAAESALTYLTLTLTLTRAFLRDRLRTSDSD